MYTLEADRSKNMLYTLSFSLVAKCRTAWTTLVSFVQGRKSHSWHTAIHQPRWTCLVRTSAEAQWCRQWDVGSRVLLKQSHTLLDPDSSHSPHRPRCTTRFQSPLMSPATTILWHIFIAREDIPGDIQNLVLVIRYHHSHGIVIHDICRKRYLGYLPVSAGFELHNFVSHSTTYLFVNLLNIVPVYN